MKTTVTGPVQGTFPNSQAVFLGAMLSPGLAAAGGQTRLVAVQEQSAADPLIPWAIAPTTIPPVVSVQLNGRNFAAALSGVTLSRYEVVITRRTRQQWAEFTYPVAPGIVGKTPIAWKNADDHELLPAALANDYTHNVGGASEHLLGFRMSVAPTGSPVYAFTKPSNNKNSYVEKVIALRNAQAANVNGQFPNFTITTAQGNLTVTPQNMLRTFAFFRYGQALAWPFPTMREFVAASAPGGGVPDLTAVRVPEPTDESLIHDTVNPAYRPAEFPYGVETLVVVMNPGTPLSLP